ncbi:MAG: hypothetical protein CSYNP_01961 [Syntrophus sp. SKADARSKE-3]|nr:hypothetical protein [Syntrophus sp. SKADARSKE-3]
MNETWLPVNTDPWYIIIMQGNSVFRLRTITGLTGYLMGSKILTDMTPSTDNRLDGMFLKLPDGVKGLQDAGIEKWENQSWLRAVSFLYRPLSGIPLLASGPATVSIGVDGFTEWRRLPSSGALSISGAT